MSNNFRFSRSISITDYIDHKSDSIDSLKSELNDIIIDHVLSILNNSYASLLIIKDDLKDLSIIWHQTNNLICVKGCILKKLYINVEIQRLES